MYYDEEIAKAGLDQMEIYMKELGLVMNLAELGVTEDMVESIGESVFILSGGYKILSKEEIVLILKKSL